MNENNSLSEKVWHELLTGTPEERESLLSLIERFAGPEKRQAVEAVLESEKGEEWKKAK